MSKVFTLHGLLWIILHSGTILLTEGDNIPTWPTKLQASIRLVQIEDPAETQVDIYFDQDQNSFTLNMVQPFQTEAQRITYLFDTNEVISIKGTSCKVSPIIDDPNRNIIPFSKDEKGNKKMADFSTILRFDPLNKAVISDITNVNGIQVEKWETSNISIPFLESFCNITHYISLSGWKSPGCKDDETCNQVILVELDCNYQDEAEMRFKAEFFNMKYEISDNEIFQQPAGIYCPDKKSSKKFPTLPSYFAFDFETYDASQESVTSTTSWSYHKKIWYNTEHSLTRKDQLTDTFEVMFTAIGDYKKKIAYSIKPAEGTCTTFPMKESDTITGDSLLPGETFPLFPDNSVQPIYVGQRKKHDLLYEVWINRDINDDNTKITDYYFMNETDSTGEVEAFHSPAFIEVHVYKDSSLAAAAFQVINKFRMKPIEWSAFDVTSCFSEEEKVRLSLTVADEKNESIADVSQKDLMDSLRDSVLKLLEISPLRLGPLQISYVTDLYLNVSLVLLEDPEKVVKNKKSKEPSLEEAFNTLETTVKNGTLQFSPSQRKLLVTDIFLPKVYIFKDKHTSDKKQGYSGNALAAVGIAMLVLGAFQGIILLIAYIRYRRADPLVRKLTGSQEVAPAPMS